MLRRQITYILVFSIFAVGCSRQPSVSVLCEKDKKGNYLLKWEIYPDVEDVPIEIYMSDNDEEFSSTPSQIIGSEQYVALINDPTHSLARKYFKVKVQDTFSGIVANRYFDMDSVQNFRDIGGYYTQDDKQVRWGKIYRSGSLKRLSNEDEKELKRLNVKNIFDIQGVVINCEVNGIGYVQIPISKSDYEEVSNRVMDGEFLRGDAVIYTQDMYKDLVDNYTTQYTKLFDALCDESSYPLVMSCYFGKDQTGLATYLLLRALNVPVDIAEDDYMRSNVGIDKKKLRIETENLSEPMQEALTILTKTDLAPLKYAVSIMRKKSGSVEKYMEDELGLTNEKKAKLRSILLY